MTAAEILKNNGLNRTHCRVLVLEQLMNNPGALSQSELDEMLRPLCNRSTLYRILNILEKHRLILRIALEDGNRFFFDESMTTDPHANDSFIFFHCTRCNNLLPLKQEEQQRITVPQGFVITEQRFLVRGTCKKCNQEKYTIKI
ncbi:MAG: transcriptional repressor [Bacteroidales bacterium]|nr:transcriptional repressor [Bacteroidales bacterium]